MPANRFLALWVLAIVGISSVHCHAWQSGSRGAASSVGNFGQPAVNLPAGPQTFASPTSAFQPFSTPTQSYGLPQSAGPVQSFSNPQSFATQQSFAPQQGFASQSGFASQQGFASGQPQGSNVNSGQAAAGSSGSLGIPSSSLVDPIFQVNNPNSPYSIDHSDWDWFLSKHVVTDFRGINRVRYGQVSSRDRQLLQAYLNRLQSTDIRAFNRNEQLAFWFNLYNARTVALAVDNYPIRSVRQIKQKFTDFVGPFDDAGAVNVLGKSLSLNDIESGIIRPVWNDPRIHYALNCASYGCPNLAGTAWTAQDLDGRLNGAAYQYINTNRGVKRGVFGPRVSKIYKWYKADFGGNDQSVLNHIRSYADPTTLSKINGHRSIRGYFYDWSLNDGRFLRPRLFESIRR